MTETIRTKQELIALFADNTTGDITPQMVRDFVASNLAAQIEVIEGAPVVVSEFVDAVICGAGTAGFTLPDASAFGVRSRTLIVGNNAGGDIVVSPAVGQTINGVGSLNIADNQLAILAADTAGNWVDIVNTAGATKTQIQVTCSRSTLNTGNHLRWGDVNGSYTVIKDSVIVAASINRSDTSGAILEILVNGFPVQELSSAQMIEVYDPLNIAVSAEDEIRIRNKSAGSSNMSGVIFSLLLEQD